jgi:hypothetical protein
MRNMSNFGNRLQRPAFVVGVHHRNKDGARRQSELQQFRASVDARFDKQDIEPDSAGKQISALSANMKELLGNGQPGRIQRLEAEQEKYQASCSTRLAALEEHKAEWKGKQLVVAAGLATAISFAIELHDHIGNAVRSLFK